MKNPDKSKVEVNSQGENAARYACPLSSFSVGGFKAFDAHQAIPLKPITLIFGANSSGKSSILHSLILAHHGLRSGDLNAHRTEVGGDSVDLGGFLQYVHRRNPDGEVILSYNFRNPDEFPFRSKLLNGDENFQVELRLGYDQRTKRPQIAGYSVGVNGEMLFRMLSTPNGEMRIPLWETGHPVTGKVFDACISFTSKRSGSEADRKIFDEAIYEILDTFRVEGDALPPYRLAATEFGQAEDHHQKMLVGDPENAIRMALSLMFKSTLEYLLHDLHELFAISIGHLEYLGPLRKLPRRHLDDDEITSEERASGAFAWKTIMDDYRVREKVNRWLGDPERLQTPYKLEVRHLVHEDSLRTAGSIAIQDTLLKMVGNIATEPESVEALTAISESEPEDVEAYVRAHPELHHQIAENWYYAHSEYLEDAAGDEEAEEYTMEAAMDDAFDSLDLTSGDSSAENVLEHFRSNSDRAELGALVSESIDAEREANSLADAVIAFDPDTKTELSIIEQRNRTALSHRDIGVGVSQILPVLVHAYASKRKLIAIEQPEIHIHPKLQAELGDVFIESALGENQNTFILETHSEHLILRILRRIRESKLNRLPEGTAPISSADVCVLFVRPNREGTAEIIELRVNDKGQFIDDWPGGFFEESFDELF